MKIVRLSMCLLMIALASGTVFAQAWDAALTTGLTYVGMIKSGYDYTLTLYNITGIPGDPTPADYDLIIWTLEPFNVPAPETITQMPDGWTWDGARWKMFEIIEESRKYYTPPAVAPGASITFKYYSTLTVSANPGGPPDGSPGFISHVAAVDPSQPGSATQAWVPYTPEGMPQTWFDRSLIPEPGSLLALATGLAASAGFLIRRRRA